MPRSHGRASESTQVIPVAPRERRHERLACDVVCAPNPEPPRGIPVDRRVVAGDEFRELTRNVQGGTENLGIGSRNHLPVLTLGTAKVTSSLGTLYGRVASYRPRIAYAVAKTSFATSSACVGPSRRAT